MHFSWRCSARDVAAPWAGDQSCAAGWVPLCAGAGGFFRLCRRMHAILPATPRPSERLFGGHANAFAVLPVAGVHQGMGSGYFSAADAEGAATAAADDPDD